MTGLIEQFGVIGVFLLMVPESACVPVPSELTLLFSGFAVHQGWMSLPLAVLAATAGNLAGSLIAYGVGASSRLRHIRLVRGSLERWEGLLERHGTRAVFIARLLPLARTFVWLPAGGRRIPLVPFVALTSVGCLLWVVAFVLAGMFAGGAWAAVESLVGHVLLGAGLLLLTASLVRRGRHRQTPRAVQYDCANDAAAATIRRIAKRAQLSPPKFIATAQRAADEIRSIGPTPAVDEPAPVTLASAPEPEAGSDGRSDDQQLQLVPAAAPARVSRAEPKPRRRRRR